MNTTRTRFFVLKKQALSTVYELGVEAGEVFKCWTLPKGPSPDPGEKRLALRARDLPPARYESDGKWTEPDGTDVSALVWDRGECECRPEIREGIAAGSAVVVLYGEKLRGEWSLERIQVTRGRESWLLRKGEDDHSAGPTDPDVLDERPESVVSDRTVERPDFSHAKK